MTADTILYACNTEAVGLFGIVLSAAFCNIRWTRRNVCCMIASTLAIFLIQGIVYLGIDPALGSYLYPLHTHLPLAITLCVLSHERLWPVISVLTAYLCCQLRRWLALVCVWALSGGDRMQYAVELIVTLPLLPLLLVLALLVLEPHMSGIVLTTAIVGTILLLGGSGGIITWGCAGVALFLLETLLKHVDSIDYLQSRLDGWTQDLDRMTSQTKQSLYAIGSGGATGLGLGNSIEKQLWLPESTNDFIFSVVCEELGFVGAVIVIVLFVLFLVQGFWIAFHAENRFCTLVGIGIMAQIAWQVFCNIAVVTNTLPNTGISLPFFSSGGTSLILLLAEMGVMVNIGRNGERARLERENLHTLREEQRKAKTIVLNTARNAQPER